MNIYKLLAGILLTIVMVVLVPYVLASLRMMPPLNSNAWLILLVTTSSLVVKSVVGDVASGEFLWHKFGYDNCVMAFGAILTALALQLVAGNDLFPGLNAVAGIKNVRIASDDATNRSVQLFLALLLALTCTLVTATISGAIKKNAAQGDAFLSLFNTAIGLSLLGCYVLTLVAKG
jgi:hypothetical protein